MHGDRGPDRDGGLDLADADGLTWSVRPCARNRAPAVVAGVFILVVSLAVQIYFESPWWTAVALILLGLSVAPYYARTSYHLDGDGVVAKGLFATYRRQWSEVKAYFPDGEGVLLTPLEKPTRLAYTRGLFIRFDDNRDEVLKRVETYMEQAAGRARAAASERGTD